MHLLITQGKWLNCVLRLITDVTSLGCKVGGPNKFDFLHNCEPFCFVFWQLQTISTTMNKNIILILQHAVCMIFKNWTSTSHVKHNRLMGLNGWPTEHPPWRTYTRAVLTWLNSPKLDILEKLYNWTMNTIFSDFEVF